MKKIFTLLFLIIISWGLHAEPVQKSGKGTLEVVEGQQVMHLHGTAYELGFQHGSLLKDQVAENVARFVDRLSSDRAPPIVQNFIAVMPQVIEYIPSALIQEMKGIADGAGIPYSKILLLNLFPEMFHCSALTVTGKASCDQHLYHVRVLDYGAAATIQTTAVLAIVEPDQGYSFLNVTYAGFIGCVTGMNSQKIAIGEIGAQGYGAWKGMPMAFLLRQIVQNTSTLQEIKQLLEATPRTCAFYYIFSDGKTRDSFAVYATDKILNYIYPGSAYPSLTSQKSSPVEGQAITYNQQPEDTIALTADACYPLLLERLSKSYGSISVADLQQVIKNPIGHPTNLHNAIFAPETLEVWLSHAGPNNEPAYDQPYVHFELQKLLK